MVAAAVREIPLTRGMSALVDAADYERVVAMGKWGADPSGRTFYARKNLHHPGRKQTTLLMHTFITGWDRVDHINGDGLDNRRANLRPATHSQNMANKRRYANNKSGYKGVYWSGRPGLRRVWAAAIKQGGKARRLGRFEHPEEAARAYDAAARELFGQFARLNFPGETVPPPPSGQAEKTSRFKGVSLIRPGCWKAHIYLGGKLRHLGHFSTPEEAAGAHDAAVREHRGPGAPTNFPSEDTP